MAHNHVGPPDKSGEAVESFGDGAGGEKTLTSSWVAGTPVDVKRFSSVGIGIEYTKGSETTARVRVMVAKGAAAPAEGARAWRKAGELGSASSGVRALTKGQVTLAPADYDTTDSVSFDVSIRNWDWVRVDAEYVGGSSPGSIYADVAGGWGL